jgi:hypothetical protein
MLGLAKQIKVVNLAELARQDAPAPNGRLVTVPAEVASTAAGD